MSKPTASPAQFFWETLGPNQQAMRDSILKNRVTFGIGPAGTGKTLVATYTALELVTRGLKNGGINRIVASRPTVVAGEELGFLPGSLDEKISPFLRPIFDLIKASNHPDTQKMLSPRNESEEILEGVAISMMRGITFHDCAVLVDEVQNLNRQQFELMLTRLGEGSKMIFTGDIDQCDIGSRSGLKHAMELLRDDEEVGIIQFTADDVRRSDFVGRVIKKYAEDRERNANRLGAVA